MVYGNVKFVHRDFLCPNYIELSSPRFGLLSFLRIAIIRQPKQTEGGNCVQNNQAIGSQRLKTLYSANYTRFGVQRLYSDVESTSSGLIQTNCKQNRATHRGTIITCQENKIVDFGIRIMQHQFRYNEWLDYILILQTNFRNSSI